MKDMKQVLKVKIYLNNLKKPMILYTDKDRKQFIDNFIDELNHKVIVTIGPLTFSVDEFICFTIE